MDNDTLLVDGYLADVGRRTSCASGRLTPPHRRWTLLRLRTARRSRAASTLAAPASDVGQGVDRWSSPSMVVDRLDTSGRSRFRRTRRPSWPGHTPSPRRSSTASLTGPQRHQRDRCCRHSTRIRRPGTTTPSDGGMSPHAVPVTMEAADSESASTASVRVGRGDVFATDNDPPYATVWNAPLVYSKTHMIPATAFDNAATSPKTRSPSCYPLAST